MTPLKRLTLADVMAWQPCMESARIRRLAARLPSPCSPVEALDGLRGRVSLPDLAWLLTQWLSRYHPGRILWWASEITDQALNHERAFIDGSEPHQALRMVRQFLRGQEIGDRTAVADDAYNTACAASTTPAYHACESAAEILDAINGDTVEINRAATDAFELLGTRAAQSHAIDRLRQLLLQSRPRAVDVPSARVRSRAPRR